MKKFLSIILTLALILSLGIPALAVELTQRQAELYYREISIVLDGKELIPTDVSGESTEPFIIDGTTYLPVRAVASALGLEVEWLPATSTIELTSGGQPDYGSGERTATKRIVSATLGYRGISIRLDGETLKLTDANGKTVEPFLMGGTTYVPVRAIASALGLDVEWNGGRSAVILSTGKVWLPTSVTRSSTSVLTGSATEETVEYEYDETGAPVSIRYSSPERSYTASLSYDESGRVTKLSVSGRGISWGYEHKYDADGRLTYEKDWDGSDYTARSYTYDKSGLLCARTDTVRRSGVTEKTEYSYTYDSAGRLLSETVKDADGESTVFYTYDSRGNLATRTGNDGKHTMLVVWSYDDADRLLSTEYYDCGTLYASEKYSYDDAGNLSCLVYTHLDFSSTTLYSYDDRGRVLSEEYSDSDGLSRSSVTEYDRYGNVCFSRVEENSADSSYFEETVFEYSPSGDLLSRSRTDSNGSESAYSAKYDALGRVTYSENVVNGNTSTYSADFELGLWPVYEVSSGGGSYTVTEAEYAVFESDEYLELLVEINQLLAQH